MTLFVPSTIVGRNGSIPFFGARRNSKWHIDITSCGQRSGLLSPQSLDYFTNESPLSCFHTCGLLHSAACLATILKTLEDIQFTSLTLVSWSLSGKSVLTVICLRCEADLSSTSSQKTNIPTFFHQWPSQKRNTRSIQTTCRKACVVCDAVSRKCRSPRSFVVSRFFRFVLRTVINERLLRLRPETRRTLDTFLQSTDGGSTSSVNYQLTLDALGTLFNEKVA